MSIEVGALAGERELKQFLDFPHELYRNDGCYVPQLFRQQRQLLGHARDPRQRRPEMELFVARRAGRLVGRIAAIHDALYDRHHDAKQGFFGFFDCVDDDEASALLFAACEEWLAARDLRGMRGPVNPDMNHSCGVLVEGFTHPPAISMPYNAPYYRRLIEGAGLHTCMGLSAWEIAADTVPAAAFERIAKMEQVASGRGYTLRALDMQRFDSEAMQLRSVYNASLSHSWGFSPISEEGFAEQAKDLMRICRPEHIQIAEHDGRIVGFIGLAPNLNEILRQLPRGRLLPWGWWRLLTGRRRIRWARIVMYGVDPGHRGVGLANLLYLAIIRTVRESGLDGAEASYVLDDNEPVNRLCARLGGIRRKRYAIFEKPMR